MSLRSSRSGSRYDEGVQPPSEQAPKPKPRWELRALGISIAVVVGVGGLSRVLFGLLGSVVGAVGLDGSAGFLSHTVPVILAFIATLVLNGLAAQTDSRGGGLGAWLGFGLVMLIFRGLAAL